MADKRIEYKVGISLDQNSLQKTVNDALSALSKISNYKTGQVFTKDLQEAADAAAVLNQALAQATNAKTGHIDLSQMKRAITESGYSVQEIADKMQAIGPEGTRAFSQVAKAVTSIQQPVKKTSELMEKMGVTLANTIRWQISNTALNTATGLLQNAYNYSKDLDRSLNNIRIVTEKNTTQMAKFAKQANAAAKALNTTTTDYTDASLIYYQQGDTDEEVESKARITIQAANVARTSAEEMSEYLTAVWNSYQAGGDTLEDFVDKMSAVGAATATSLEEISTAMTKVASTASTVGVSFDQLTSIVATISSVTRTSAESVGTALKTVFARMEDLDINGKSEDGATLGNVSNQLKEVGINVLDAQGNLRDLGGVIEEVGAKWQTWNNNTKVAVAQAVAGTRQYTQLMALFENWDMYQETLSVSEGSEGTLAKQANIYAQSWEAARDRVTAAAEGIYDSLINENAFIEMADATVPLLEGIEAIVDGLGGMEGVITTISYLITNLAKNKMISTFDTIGTNWQVMFGSRAEQDKDYQNEWAAASENQAATSPHSALSYVETLRAGLTKEQMQLLGNLTDEQKEALKFEIRRKEVMIDYLESLEKANDEQKEATANIKEDVDVSARRLRSQRNNQSNTDLTGSNVTGIFSNLKHIAPIKGGYYTRPELLRLNNNDERTVQDVFSKTIVKMAEQAGSFASMKANYETAVGNNDTQKQQQYLDEIAQLFSLNPAQMSGKVVDELSNELDTITERLRAFYPEGEQGRKQFLKIWEAISGKTLTQEQIKTLEETLLNNDMAFKGVIPRAKKVSEALGDMVSSFTAAQMAGQGLVNVFDSLGSGNFLSIATSIGQATAGFTTFKKNNDFSQLKGMIQQNGGLKGLKAGDLLGAASPWLTAAITAFTTISAIVDKINEEKIKKLQESSTRILENTQATREEADANDRLIKSYQTLLEEYDGSIEGQKEIREAALNLIKTYDLEEMSLKALTGSYADYKDILDATTKARDKEIAKAKQQADSDYIAASRNVRSLSTIGRGRESGGSYFIDFERSLWGNEEFKKAVENSEFLSNAVYGGDETQFRVDYTAEAIAKLYKELQAAGVSTKVLTEKLGDLQPALEAYYKTKEHVAYYSALGINDDAIKNIESYNTYIKELEGIVEKYHIEDGESFIDRVIGDTSNEKLSELHAITKTLDGLQEKYLLSKEYVDGIKEEGKYTAEALAQVSWAAVAASQAFEDLDELSLDNLIGQAQDLADVTSHWNNLSSSIDQFIESYDSLTKEVFDRADLKEMLDLDIWGKNGLPEAAEFIKMLGEDRTIAVNFVADKLEKAELETAKKREEEASKALEVSKSILSNYKDALNKNAEYKGEYALLHKDIEAFSQAREEYNDALSNLARFNYIDADDIEDPGAKNQLQTMRETGVENAEAELQASIDKLKEHEIVQQALEAEKIPNAIKEQTRQLLEGMGELVLKNGDAKEQYKAYLEENGIGTLTELEDVVKNLPTMITTELETDVVNKQAALDKAKQDALIAENSTITSATKGSGGSMKNLSSLFPDGAAFNQELKAMAGEVDGAIDELHTYNETLRTMGAASKEASNALLNLKTAVYKGVIEANALTILKSISEDDKYGMANALSNVFGFTVDPEAAWGQKDQVYKWLTGNDSERKAAGWDIITSDVTDNYLQSILGNNIDPTALGWIKELLKYGTNTEDFYAAASSILEERGMEISGDTGRIVIEYAEKLYPYLKEMENLSGSAGDYTDKWNDSLKLVEERYVKINHEIDKQNKLIDKTGVKIDRAYGKENISNYSARTIAYGQQEINENNRADKARDYLATDKTVLADAINTTGLKDEINFDYSTADNFFDGYEDFVNTLNAKLKGNLISQVEYDEIIKAAEQVKATYEVITDAEQKAYDNKLKKLDSTIDELTITLSVELDEVSLQKELSDFQNRADKLTKTSLNQDLDNAYDLNKYFVDIGALSETAHNTLASLIEQIKTPDIDKNKLVEGFRSIMEYAEQSLGNVEELIEAIGSLLPNAIERSNKEMDKLNARLNHHATVSTTIKEIETLTGQFQTRDNIYAAQAKATKAIYDAEVQSLKVANDRLAIAEKAKKSADENLKALIGNANLAGIDVQDNPLYQSYKEAADLANENYQAALEAQLAAGKSVLEAAGNIYFEAIDKAQHDFAQAITKSEGLELLQSKYDNFVNTEERYLDIVNEAYEVNSWNRKLQLAIDETTSAVAKKRYKELQDEMDIRRKNNQLSQYDLDILNAKFEMTQAQLALEEAQANATTMRLSRDSQGNWGYTFTADADAITEAQNKFDDASNEYYNIAKDKTKETTGEIIKAYDEMSKKIADVYKDTGKTTAEREKEIAEIRKYYNQLIIDLESEKQNAIADMTEAGGEVIGRFGESYQDTMSGLTSSTDTFKEKFETYLLDCQTALSAYEANSKTLLDNNQLSWTSVDAQVNITADSIKNVGTELGILAPALTNHINQVSSATSTYTGLNTQLKEAIDNYRKLHKESGGQISALQGGSGVDTKYDTNVDYAAVLGYLYQNKEKYSNYNDIKNKLEGLRADKIVGEDMQVGEYKHKELTDQFLSSVDWKAFMNDKDIAFILGQLGAIKMATGGYTGEFSGGKLGILHEKELVLNKEDTENMLAAVTMARTVAPTIFRTIASMLDNNATIGYNLMQEKLGASSMNTLDRTIQQNVSIEASFPGVESAVEIETALNDLVNGAIQYISNN